MSKNSKNIFSLFSAFLIFFMTFSLPLAALAQAVDPSVIQLRAQSAAISAQGAADKGGTGTAPTTSASASVGGIAAAAGSCSIGALAGQMLAGTISGVVGSVFGAAKSTLTGKIADVVSFNSVPTHLTDNSEAHLSALDNSSNLQTKKTVTSSAGPGGWDGIVTSFTNIFSAPSLDAIGFCVANEMIAYIARSTIQWINSGFKGSPVFVSNTGQFFKGIQEQELGNFVNGLAQGTLGINLCQPFKVAVLTSTLGGNGGNGYNPLSCTLNQIKNNYKQFTGGQWSAGGFPGWFELIQQPNNVYGATLAAQQQAYINITTKQNTALIDLNWNKGYKNFTACADKSTPDAKTGKCANGMPEVTTTLGGYIENQVNVRGASGSNRLNIATSFDQVVSALVNELIKIAINKVFDNSGATTGSTGGGSSGSNSQTYATLNATCAAVNTAYLPTTTSTSTIVTWSSNVTGGSGNFTYIWGGDANGSVDTVANNYSIDGIKIATLTVHDNITSQTTYANCSTDTTPPNTITHPPLGLLRSLAISSLSRSSGPSGLQVTITGTGFDSTQNYVLFNGLVASPKLTSNGTSLVFIVPSVLTPQCNLFSTTEICPNTEQTVSPDNYSVSVITPKGTSSSVNFTVTQ